MNRRDFVKAIGGLPVVGLTVSRPPSGEGPWIYPRTAPAGHQHGYIQRRNGAWSWCCYDHRVQRIGYVAPERTDA